MKHTCSNIGINVKFVQIKENLFIYLLKSDKIHLGILPVKTETFKNNKPNFLSVCITERSFTLIQTLTFCVYVSC